MWPLRTKEQMGSSDVKVGEPSSVPFADESTRSLVIDIDSGQIGAVEQRDPIAALRHTYRVEEGCAVGIDIGATNIKTVALTKGQTVAVEVHPTWPGVVLDGTDLLQRVMGHVAAAANALPERCGAIGVAWSGQMRLTDSKLIAWRHWIELPAEQFAKFDSLKAALGTRFPRARVEIQKDAAMGAFAVRVTEGLADAIVIDVGTDISGGRINAEGNVDFRMPMEIGAMVIAMGARSYTPWAPPGNLTDYASGAAIRRLAREAGVRLDDEPRALGPIAADSAAARALRSQMARALGHAVMEIKMVVPARAFRFSGGVMSALGKALLPEIRSAIAGQMQGVALDVAVCTVDPMFCGALGAAHYANALAQAQSVKDTFGEAMRAAVFAVEQAEKNREKRR